MVPTVLDTAYGVDTQEYVAQGRHVIQTLKGCPPELLNDEIFLKEACSRAVEATGAQILNVISHHFEPQGATVLLLLSESHASIHTYPEVGVAFWDCFTCGWECDPAKSVEVLNQVLKPTTVDWSCIIRGEGYEN